MARTSSAMDVPFHTDIGFLAQRGRGLLRDPNKAQAQARRLLLRRRPASRDQPLPRRAQSAIEGLHLDRQSRRNHRRSQARAPSVRFDPLAVGDTITVSPTNIVYGIPLFGPLSPPLVVSWTDSLGAFQETFDDRMKNAGDSLVQIVSIGTITGPGASGGAEIQLIADSGPFTSAIGVLLLDNSGEQGVASTPPAIPEPSTWVLMLAGFAG